MGEPSVESNSSRRSLKGLARRQVAAVSLAGLVLLLATAAALAVTGDLSQPTGNPGCVSETGAGPCADGHRLIDPTSVAVSPDGKSVYVASFGEQSAVARLNRNTATGGISQPPGSTGCISETASGPCAVGHALQAVFAVAVSADGKNVYTASAGSSAVARLNRNPTTGAITQPTGNAGCVSDTPSGTGAEPCADGHGLYSPAAVAVSPDGKSVYVAAVNNNAVARLNRNPTTGAITQPPGTGGCISENGAGTCVDGRGLNGVSGVAVSPDGKSVYAASLTIHAVARFDRNTTTGAITQPDGEAGCISQTGEGPCADGHGLRGAWGVAVSPDGNSVYVASYDSDAVALFNRDATGAITQPADAAGCISETGAGPCANGHGLMYPQSVAVSADGKSVYATSVDSNAVTRFNRNTTTGAISQPVATAGCVSETGAGLCANGHALDMPYSVAVSPNGQSVYVASRGSNAVARLNRTP